MFVSHSRKGIFGAGGALVVLLAVQPLSAQYVFHDLGALLVNSAGGFNGSYNVNDYVRQPVGAGSWGSSAVNHALYWIPTFPNSAGIDLNPSGFDSSVASGGNGTQQVGSGLVGSFQHALLWSGSAASAVDLNPTNISGVLQSSLSDTNGAKQVGWGTVPDSNNLNQFHAMIWSGSANTAVDLMPTNLAGFVASQASGISPAGTQEVGIGLGLPGGSHALLWNNANPATTIDLHPTSLSTSFTDSNAFNTSGTQQTGFGHDSTGRSHALLWTGTAASAGDLSPSIGSYTNSEAIRSNGLKQVGDVFDPNNVLPTYAVVWSGTAASAFDLGALMPAGWTWSIAYSIDSNGNIFGNATDQNNTGHAAEWSPVPEPSGLGLGIVTLACLMRRTRS